MNPKVKDAIQAALDRCFTMNAICDRMVYVMHSQWYLSDFAKMFHDSQAQTYRSPGQMLEKYRDEVLITRRMIGDAYYSAFDNAEAGVAACLCDILEDFQEDMVARAILMAGKAARYGDNFAEFDSDTKLFFD